MVFSSHYRRISQVAPSGSRGILFRICLRIFPSSWVSFLRLPYWPSSSAFLSVVVSLAGAALLTLAAPAPASADILYSQTADGSGSTSTPTTSDYYTKVGSFSWPVTGQFGGDVQIYWEGKGGTLGQEFTFRMSTTTCTNNPSSIGNFTATAARVVSNDGAYHANQQYFSTSTLTIPAFTTVCVYATSNVGIGGNVPRVRTNAAGTQFYGEITKGEVTLDHTTRIIESLPVNGSVVATTTTGTIGATVWVNGDDWATAGFNDWQITARIISPGTEFGGGVTQPPVTIPITDSGLSAVSTTTYENGNTISFQQQGVYQVQYLLQKPAGGLLNYLLGIRWDTVAASSTRFVAGTSTAAEDLFSQLSDNIAGFSSEASSTLTVLGCFTFDIGKCLIYIFQPDRVAGYSDLLSFQNFPDRLSKKPPFGYWTQATALLSTTTASTTPPVYFLGAAAVAEWLTVLVGGISNIILLLLAIWIFQRISYWDWHV